MRYQQLQLFTRPAIAAIRDRTKGRNHSPAKEEFRREHARRRRWGLARRHAQKLCRSRGCSRECAALGLHDEAEAVPPLIWPDEATCTHRPQAAPRAEPAPRAQATARTDPTRQAETAAQTPPARRTKAAAQTAPARQVKAAAQTAPARQVKAAAQTAPARQVKAAARTGPARHVKTSAEARPAHRAKAAARTAPAGRVGSRGSDRTHAPARYRHPAGLRSPPRARPADETNPAAHPSRLAHGRIKPPSRKRFVRLPEEEIEKGRRKLTSIHIGSRCANCRGLRVGPISGSTRTAGATIDGAAAIECCRYTRAAPGGRSRRRVASWLGGAPNWRRYSRLNWEGLS